MRLLPYRHHEVRTGPCLLHVRQACQPRLLSLRSSTVGYGDYHLRTVRSS